jgi:16S rRNA (uracil1498-N3)-methyltransferase
MRLRRVFVAAPLHAGEALILPAAAAQHLVRVLRLGEGDEVVLFNDTGREFPSRIASVDRHGLRADVLACRERDLESPLAITLVQGICRGERMDWVVQKATELGASRIIPVLTSRSVVRLRGSRADRRLTHWQAVARSACEQSGRNRVPIIDQPASLETCLAQLPPAGLLLLLAPESRARLADHDQPVSTISLLVGPEGGLSPAEIELASELGFRSVRLGPRILRTETAAVTAIALVQARWGDL